MKRFFRTLIILICAVGAVLALTYAGIDLYGYKQQSERADVICLFGAAVWGNSPSPELEARILCAVQLYREGRAPLLFLSGGPTGSNLSESDVMGAVAIKQGVPRSALIFDNAGVTTAQTLINLKRYMQGNALTSCLMVSSPFHMARIMVLASLYGLQAFTNPPVETPVWLSVPQRARAIVREELALFKDLLVFAVSPD
ncbi:YdcF family protein [Candidatus Cryosericum hinesii]|uniref:YdcF family protein n=1 Tax=Candidatus Cryosericum hinesii TaxID=2290915 RepID=UPI001403C885|nr:YdcF family protein [Candidatus Cryosericum hinesii]